MALKSSKHTNYHGKFVSVEDFWLSCVEKVKAFFLPHPSTLLKWRKKQKQGENKGFILGI